jgi:hypothetical protein
MKNNKEQTLKFKLARLEMINDQLLTEIQYVDQLLRQAGFERGLESLKAAGQELIELER